MLSVQGVTVAYGQVTAVRDASLDVGSGEIVAIVGANGAGKTSLLHAIAGVVRPSDGTVRLDRKMLTGRPPEMIVREGVALVPEGRRIFGGLTVEENLRLANLRHDSLYSTYERFPALKTRRNQPAGVLSGGEGQQLAIARALLTRPTILLMDEPSLGLSPLLIDTVFAIVEHLRADGFGILLVEQKARRAVELADRSLLMRQGRLSLLDEAAEDLFGAYLGVQGVAG